jgi:hypothetical protein
LIIHLVVGQGASFRCNASRQRANQFSQQKIGKRQKLCLDGLNMHSVELNLSYEMQIETAEKSA